MRLFFLMLFLPLLSWSQTNTTYDFQKFKEENIDKVVTKLSDNTSLSLFAAGTITTYMWREHDAETRQSWVDHQRISESSSKVGDILGSGWVSAGIVAGQYLWDGDRSTWQSHARSLVWQTAFVGLIKYTTGVQRPGNKNRYESFPSGHTATAFATATSLTYSYGWKAAVIAYPVAAFVGMTRLSDDMHWASDVWAGAFAGFIMARASASDEASTGPKNSQWIPIISPELKGINYVYSF